jgi:hypothetical protein
MLKIELFWNITGRYLGFKLPEGEFLSKTEHVKFNSNEYDVLHRLLADRNSALANYSLKELAPEKDSSNTKVDAVSSATIAAVLDYIVPGAVYTTYTLWHFVYGPTKREIERISSQKLSAEIVLDLLKSTNSTDQSWALTHINAEMEVTESLLDKFMELVSGDDSYLTERALNALKPENLTSEIQTELFDIFNKTGFLQKSLIIQKLKEAPKLDDEVIKSIASNLPNLNGVLVKNVLDMFAAQKIENEFVTEKVAALLQEENRYISNLAFKYLENAGLRLKCPP